MALTLGDNFSYGGSKPLDARLKYATLADMKTVADATMYDGCLAYCVATDKTYQWKSTNTVDTDTGRWREFETGGGGVTPVITATATADATSSATPTVNVTKTGTDAAPNFAFSFSGLKGAKGDTGATGATGPQGPSGSGTPLTYSTSERAVGTWIDGKTIYQKTLPAITGPSTKIGQIYKYSANHNIANIDNIVGIDSWGKNTDNSIFWQNNYNGPGDNATYIACVDATRTKVEIITNFDASGQTYYVTLRYTKTTN